MIRRTLERLPVQGDEHQGEASSDEFIGSVNEVLLRIEDQLEEEFKETESDAVNDGYDFEYVLTKDGYSECEVGIMTRLFSSTSEKGSIFYEVAIIRRVDKDRYSVRIDDE